MIEQLNQYIPALESMKKYPKELYILGNKELLTRPKVSIVGTRRPSGYTKQFTCKNAPNLATPRINTWTAYASTLGQLTHPICGQISKVMRI